MAEKQAHRRTRGRLRVRYGVQTLDRSAFTNNVSLSGAFVKTNNVLKPGTTMQLEFEFPEQKLTLWAQVVWAKKVPVQMAHILHCGMGVRFIDSVQGVGVTGVGSVSFAGRSCSIWRPPRACPRDRPPTLFSTPRGS